MVQLLILIAVITAAILIVRELARRSGGWTSGQHPREALLLMCHGRHDVVRRLIVFELERAPKISEREAAARAVDRLRRDRR